MNQPQQHGRIPPPAAVVKCSTFSPHYHYSCDLPTLTSLSFHGWGQGMESDHAPVVWDDCYGACG